MGDSNLPREYQQVGIVTTIRRFPVKSMAGEEVEQGHLGWHGLDGDRRFAFLQSQNRTGFPWLTAREHPKLVLYQPYFVNPSDVGNSAVRVKCPDGQDLPVDGDDLLERIRCDSGRDVQLIQVWRGVFDTMEVSLMSVTSAASLEKMLDQDLDARRFRSNLTVEPSAGNDRQFPEDEWVGRLLKFGDRDDSARIRIKKKDVRCMIVNLDPNSAEQNPAVLKEIVAKREQQFGVYGATERPGTIKIGDSVLLAR